MKQYKLMLGDNMASLKKLPDNSIDSVVTDPPYALTPSKGAKAGFMGKLWDAEVPSVEFWKEVYRVLKPGGHILSFGGTRTYHRMVVNIEDAGFEIRDQIMWIYGSGFPKSHNIGKAVDKIEGNKREVVGTKTGGAYSCNTENVGIKQVVIDCNDGRKTKPTRGEDFGLETKGNSQYEGYGTALKPAQEIICVAKKPEDTALNLFMNLIYNIKKELLCQLKLNVNVVKENSRLNQVEQKEVLDSAQLNVEQKYNIQEDLQDLMDILQSKLMEHSNLNIAILWSKILVELCEVMNKCTIEMKLSLITELKILNLLEWQNILNYIIHHKNNQIDGVNVNVLTAEIHFSALNLKLKDIQQHFAAENVTNKVKNLDSQNEPICVARKPLSEKTVAANMMKWGTGGINIDGCRIETSKDELEFLTKRSGVGGHQDDIVGGTSLNNYKYEANSEGRFPANIIFDEEAAQLLDEQSGVSKSTGGKKDITITNNNNPSKITTNIKSGDHFNDKGGASRFFYVAKVSKKERNMGLDEFEDKTTKIFGEGVNKISGKISGNQEEPKKNFHPTVKPINLMTYLIRLVTPENGIILEPFMGSGSTGVAAMLEGRRFVGMEMDEDYFKIAEKRIESWEEYKKIIK